jgi:2-polyprenyl-3-methyl-5-hydroxy-6-metoxy-1,4-benzoquinol methylase
MGAKEHWETVYKTKSTTEVSWFQREARVSLDLITRVAPKPDSAIVDVGGGASTLVDGLLSRGYRNVTVLDIASAAINAAQVRLGPAATNARWIAADALEYAFLPHSVDVWHDRAVFHFLTSPADRRTYVAQVSGAVRPNGHVIVATFAADGPTRCSGLDVCRYGPEELHGEFGNSFDLIAHVREEHVTPSGARQRFQYCLCEFRPAKSVAA